MSRSNLLGMAGEFAEPRALAAAARAARQAGYTRMDAFTPFPMPELDEPLDLKDDSVDWGTLVGAFFGIAFGAFVGWYVNVVAYPLDIGGRPVDSWPAFVLPAVETGLLFGAVGALLTMLRRNGLPRLHHPVFEIPGFDKVTDDRFFLLIDARDPQYHPALTRRLLERAGAHAVTEVGQRWIE